VDSARIKMFQLRRALRLLLCAHTNRLNRGEEAWLAGGVRACTSHRRGDFENAFSLVRRIVTDLAVIILELNQDVEY
jgi:hypothetical protein